jgi:hypothetical protein
VVVSEKQLHMRNFVVGDKRGYNGNNGKDTKV